MKAPRHLVTRSFCLCMATAWRTTSRTQARLGGLCSATGERCPKSDRMYDKGREAPLRITLFRDFQFTM
jgi:hypothetical protein